MSTDCTLYVERYNLKLAIWEFVHRGEWLVAQEARRIYPAGPLMASRLREAEAALRLGERWVAYAIGIASWPVRQDYDLFGQLAGVRGRGPAIVPPRGIPTDASPEVRRVVPVPNVHDIPGSARESWLTLAELEPIQVRDPAADPVHRQFREEVMRPMARIHPDPTRVRAVFWFGS